jgi:nitrogen fixation NifU-like protein
MGKYSDVLMDHFFSPRNAGRIEGADRTGSAGAPGSGPYILLYLLLEKGAVKEARFQTYGCGAAIASASMLTELITNRSIPECLTLTEEELGDALGGVPADKLHCPALAIAALRDALKQDRVSLGL